MKAETNTIEPSTPAPFPVESVSVEPEGSKPVDEVKRAKAAAKAAVRRRIEKLKAAKSVDELERLMKQEVRSEAAPADAEPAAPTQSAPEQSAPAGWPLEEAVRAATEPAEMLWSQAALLLKGTRYALDKDKQKVLVNGTAPLLAKWLPVVGNTPEAAFIVAVTMVFGPPAIAHLMEPKEEKIPGLAELAEAKAA
jgi:hypothetical protein